MPESARRASGVCERIAPRIAVFGGVREFSAAHTIQEYENDLLRGEPGTRRENV